MTANRFPQESDQHLTGLQPTPSPPESRNSAYGLTFADAPRLSEWLGEPTSRDWPRVSLLTSRADLRAAELSVNPHRALLPLPDGGRIDIVRDPPAVHFQFVRPFTAQELVHPLLGPAAGVLGRWLGREALHAGAFIANGHAWVVLGGNLGGKSTLLAGLALAGHDILADDVMVIEGGRAFAGPRCIDLRLPVPAELELDRDLVPVRGGVRGRLIVDDCVPEAPVAGFIHLSWTPDGATSLRSLPARERIARLAAHRRWIWGPDEPSDFLQLAALPAFELSRAKTSGGLTSAVAQLASLPRV
jgi:hypothetical protein